MIDVVRLLRRTLRHGEWLLPLPPEKEPPSPGPDVYPSPSEVITSLSSLISHVSQANGISIATLNGRCKAPSHPAFTSYFNSRMRHNLARLEAVVVYAW